MLTSHPHFSGALQVRCLGCMTADCVHTVVEWPQRPKIA